MVCPFCEVGRFEREVLETLDAFYKCNVKLTKQQARFLSPLFHKNGIVRTESLLGAVWYDYPDGEPEWAENALKVQLHKIRQKMKVAGLALKIHPVKGVGYVMEKFEESPLMTLAVNLLVALLCIYPAAKFMS